MSDDISDSRGRQTALDSSPYEKVLAGVDLPKQNNYQKIIDEMFWMRKELEDLRQVVESMNRDLFDTNELIGRLATQIEVWVGVAEE